MNATTSSQTHTGGSLHPIVVQCDWMTGRGTKREPSHPCQNAAAWRWENKRRGGFWNLCDEHKRLVLDSYNDEWRAKETPEWKPIRHNHKAQPRESSRVG